MIILLLIDYVENINVLYYWSLSIIDFHLPVSVQVKNTSSECPQFSDLLYVQFAKLLVEQRTLSNAISYESCRLSHKLPYSQLPALVL